MSKSISVSIQGREYTLRVEEKDEALTREIASYVDSRLTAYRKSLPGQNEATTAILTCLAIAEELFECKNNPQKGEGAYEEEVRDLSRILESVLAAG